MSTTLGANNLEQLDKKVLKAFNTGAKGYLSQYENVAIVEKPERKDERFVIVQTDSAVSEVSDGAAYPTQDVSEIGANTISQHIFKSAIPIGDLSELFDNYGAIERTAQTRGYHFQAKTDSLVAAIFNNATSTTAPYGININGTTYALNGTTQAIGKTGTTQSNRVTGNLDKSTLNTARVYMRKMKDHDGMIANYQARRLLVPSEEMMNAWQLTMSGGEPESANRNDNYVKSLGLQIIEWPLLTSTTACWLMADKSDVGMKGVRLEVAEMPTVRRILYPSTGNWVYQYRMVLFPGSVDYVGNVSIGL